MLKLRDLRARRRRGCGCVGLTPERWLPVTLGTHSFGHLRTPGAIVAKAGPDQVGFWSPPGGEGESYAPDSFDVARDGSIWLVDREFNSGRLLVWAPGQPSAPARTVTLPFRHR